MSDNENFQADELESKAVYKKRLILFVLALALLFVAGGWGIYRYVQRSQPAPKPVVKSTVQSTPPPAVEGKPTEKIPDSFRLKPFQINLPGGRSQIVKLGLVIAHRGDEGIKKELKKREPQIRNLVIFIVQSKTKAFLLGPGGQEALRKEIRIEINRVMRRKIQEVYLVEFIVQ